MRDSKHSYASRTEHLEAEKIARSKFIHANKQMKTIACVTGARNPYPQRHLEKRSWVDQPKMQGHVVNDGAFLTQIRPASR